MITIEDIKKELKQAIQTSGKTQTQIAKELHVTQQTVQQYVSGRSLPALDTLANLCVLLDLDANELLKIR
ncbi:MAG: helix-turn-helix transcriptional regulator [Clostridia bacterium]|nr:helix-turn-helix transcriptional regulator [Clostridia bacterium]